MKDPSRPPSRCPPSEPEAVPRQDTPFDPFRFRIQTIPMELQRELIALKRPLLDPKDLEDTYPPNGRLAAPETLEAPSEPAQRHRGVVAVGLVALVVTGAAIVWPLVTSPKPAASPVTTAVATPRDAEAVGARDAERPKPSVPRLTEAPANSAPRHEAPTPQLRTPEVSAKASVKAASVAGASQRARTIVPAQPRTAASTDGTSAATTQPVVGTSPDPALPKSGSPGASASAPTSVNNPRRIDQLLYQ